MKKYSVILLKESKIASPVKNDCKIFEESIILCSLSENFFNNNSYEDILNYFIQKIPPYKYENAYCELVSKEIVAVIDFFYVLDNVNFQEFSEVYSRHFIETPNTTLKDVIEKYYFDFSLINENK